MNNHLIAILSLIVSSTLFMAGCSDTSAFENPATSGTNDIQTQVPDQNSFTLSTEKLAVEGIGYNGNTSIITARASDRHNNPVPDNTSILFLTNGGSVEPQCFTTDGVCSVTWTEQNPTPAGNVALVLVYTTGEESFLDLNDNDAFDAGESFTDIPEPFFDLDNNGARDPSTEEFVDFDGDNTFDDIDGLFTGTPCIGDTTVCNRVSTLIWDIMPITISSSFATISSFGTLPTTQDTATAITYTITDNTTSLNPMASGTTVTFTAKGGTVDPASAIIGGNITSITVLYTSGSSAGVESLSIKVTSEPSGDLTIGTPLTATVL